MSRPRSECMTPPPEHDEDQIAKINSALEDKISRFRKRSSPLTGQTITIRDAGGNAIGEAKIGSIGKDGSAVVTFTGGPAALRIVPRGPTCTLDGVPGRLFARTYRRGKGTSLTEIEPTGPEAIDGKDLVFVDEAGHRESVWLAGFDADGHLWLSAEDGLPEGVPVCWAR